jgi:hypothetical protein
MEQFIPNEPGKNDFFFWRSTQNDWIKFYSMNLFTNKDGSKSYAKMSHISDISAQKISIQIPTRMEQHKESRIFDTGGVETKDLGTVDSPTKSIHGRFTNRKDNYLRMYHRNYKIYKKAGNDRNKNFDLDGVP